ncbi:MAG: hypothetical protein A2275_09425 [Bacteroidetes bacterium RIFOXYA12_FULL_35_11]|nr:MAG: hypothetical protein A2X01_01050 [Bacteroidetes bacterium GWF2_35_48]OFY76113.1 MAG: hypothetical protein A2275_09425 [Bacteroidetes bacterium RIFOXYA12_FULL_35_11]OFY94284.1 MAG: hypothetical protein A2309_05785 [Bacteroidetes bacterium RIFOXYB2_FULL_35_7]OFZ05621.1 MAG: hypothetical protein A2491_17495 [Bacteroidetes bacterium RIFOXYC12_FULL_35_7]HBX51166.1 addiction module component CHP02574 family protein [Bacteroidales bacterium]
MNLQYITDNKGQTAGVFIPIQDWNQLKKIYKELEKTEENFVGIPDWHKSILDKRLNSLKNNTAVCTDFDKACDEIEKEL